MGLILKMMGVVKGKKKRRKEEKEQILDGKSL